jgi:hypothetical protein
MLLPQEFEYAADEIIVSAILLVSISSVLKEERLLKNLFSL